ncbi:endonuclease MutS2 [Gemmatimonadota bacterium]
MRHFDLDRLSFRDLLERIARGTFTPRGGRTLESSYPLESLPAVHNHQGVVSEVSRALDGSPRLPFQSIPEVEDNLLRLRQTGAVLDGVGLRDLGTVAAALDELREWTHSHGHERLPTVQAIHGFPERYSVEAARIKDAIDHEGRVKDDATDLLASLRRKVLHLRERLRQDAHEITERLYREGLAQEPEPALREGRYVVSVRAESRAKVSGVAIDRSRSGQSVFIEPHEISETALELKEVMREEAREVERILTELSALFATRVEGMDADLDRLAILDAAQAAARYSEAGPFALPAVGEGDDLALYEARHPLLAATHGNANVVPLTVALPPETRTLVISGPNSGGKTVALQTIGLCAALALSGLPIPASEESRIPWLERIHVDIGDEQSIEADLSTFTARLRRLREMLGGGPVPQLNLIDEAGAGTDPAQGAALAIAILEKLTGAGSYVVCITHDSRIKTHAAQTEGMANGRMVFSNESLTPTYEFQHGAPGRSFAFEIAARSGIPDPVVDRARKLLGPAGENLERALREAEEIRERIAGLERTAEIDARKAEAARKKYELLASELAEGEKRERKRAAETASAIIQDARKTVEQVVREIREAKASASAIRDAHETIRTQVEKVDILREEAGPEHERGAGKTPLVEGMTVFLKGLDRSAEVLSVDGGRVRVMAGSISLDVARTDVEPVLLEPVAPRRFVVTTPLKTVPPTLDIIGQRAEAARNTIEKYLDDAILGGLTRVRIIHGSGAGVLRKVVDEVLRGHDQVKEYGVEIGTPGGAGVTWVNLEGAPV